MSDDPTNKPTDVSRSLPTSAEAGFPSLVISTWYGVWAPPRLPGG